MNKTLQRRFFSLILTRCLPVFVLAMLLAPESAYAQNTVISVEMKDVPIREVLSEIEKTTSYRFFYSDSVTPLLNEKATITKAAANINAAMDAILSPAGLTYRVTGTQVSILGKKGTPVTVTGTVTDDAGEPLYGVSVLVKSRPGVGVATDVNGQYRLNVPDANMTLVFNFLGMKAIEMKMQPSRTVYDVQMKSDDQEINTVVVISDGMFERDKVSFTGSVNTVTGDELRMVGTRNVLQSLKTLDPSFVVVDNLSMGSDPNTMASIELRGQGSATINAIKDEFSNDPNQPLFVLDGMEVSISIINDLDMTRVESVTILKDAGSTAIYGSRGANGVVVIETVKPKIGELKVKYTGDFSLDTPDLTVYNMMNAAEKLEFERLAGKYTASGNDSNAAKYQKELNLLYASRLMDVQRGVDTYWLSEPLRVGFTNAHSVRVSLGNKELSMDLGGKYRNNQGVMKGSKRDTWAGDVNIRYRTDKLNITNFLTISGYNAENSNYGSFKTWVGMSPYFRKYDNEGRIIQVLQYKDGLGSSGNYSPIPYNIISPLYNASLRQINTENQLYLSNNLQAVYTINKYLRVNAGLTMTRAHTRKIDFIPAEHSLFMDDPDYKKGRYTNRETKQTSVRANVDLRYAQVFNEVHSLSANVRGQIRQANNDYIGLVAEGFPYNSKPYPSLARNYKEEAKPDFYMGKSREVNLVGTVNYNYDRRYLIDFSYSQDGTSTFGSNKLYKSFWSTGIGWNINRESFLSETSWLDILKLRASTGIAGNQNVGSVSSSAIYTMLSESNRFGLAYSLSNPGNPNLPWQVSHDMGVGLDFGAMGGRFSLTFDVYRKKTDPLVIFVPQAPSTGVPSFPREMGWLKNTGFDFIASASPIWDNQNRIYLTFRVTGAHNKSVYGGLESALEVLNKEQIESSRMRQYRNGYSPTAIWAVRSNGIDPATGEEVFIKKNGDLTFDYTADDMVVVGDERPDLMGVVQSILRYKGFFVNLSFRYSFGSDVYNSALYDKVENITSESLISNQDKRALYDRWQKPGDLKPFKSVKIVKTVSPQTSRFVQKNNYFHADAISVGYDFNRNPWLKKVLSIESLSIQATTNDVFRIETSKTERGIDYPFARYFSMTLSATF